MARVPSTLEYERARETYARTKFQYKIDRPGWPNEKNEANKLTEATKENDTKHVQKKKAEPKSQGTGMKSENSDTSKNVAKSLSRMP